MQRPVDDTAADDVATPQHSSSGDAASLGEQLHGVFTPFSVRLGGKTLLRGTVLVLLGVFLAVAIVLAVNHAYSLDMFTLWSMTALLAFLLTFAVALFYERWLLTLVVLFWLPVVLSRVTTVAVAVVLILQNNADLLVEGTRCEEPPPADPDRTLEQVHTGDWVEHPLPWIAMLFLVLVGFPYLHHIVVRSLRSWNPVFQWLYFVWWLCAPLVLMVVYSLGFDIRRQYPTSWTVAEWVLIVGAVHVGFQLYYWLMFTARYSLTEFHTYWWLPTPQELADGHLRGSGAPNPQALRLPPIEF